MQLVSTALEVPRPGAEAVRRRRERAHRADLDDVAREVRGERVRGVGDHLGVVPTSPERDERITRDLVREASAAAALDAPLAVQQHEIRDRDRLLPVALLLDEARLARAERQRGVLERALAAAVTDRAIKRVVDEEELEHAVLSLARRVGRGVHDHAVGDDRRARDLQAAHALDLDEAHPTHPDRLHALVVTEPRDVGAVVLGHLDQQVTRLRLHLTTVHGQRDLAGRARRQHVVVRRRPLAHRDTGRPLHGAHRFRSRPLGPAPLALRHTARFFIAALMRSSPGSGGEHRGHCTSRGSPRERSGRG